MDFLKRKPNNTVPSKQSPIERSINNNKSTEKSVEKPLEDTIKSTSDFMKDEVKIDSIDNITVDNITLITQIEKKVMINDLLPKKVDQGTEPSMTDKKIEMKYIKDGRSHRTFVFNLELYIKNKEDLNKIINKMKKSFGTQCVHKETEFGFAYGFAGDLSARIKQYLIESHLVTAENFK